MAPLKFAIKCGNFAVLVDLHVLPLGGREDAGWFPADHIQEVAVLVRDAVDRRVKQYTESLHNGRQHKQKKELAPAAAFFVKGGRCADDEAQCAATAVVTQRVMSFQESPHLHMGKNFNLAANFLRRHFNLRCLDKQLYGDLRVFPERYVVCASGPEDAAAHHGNPSVAANQLGEQSRSEYFSRMGETQETSYSPTKTKKTVLQKIAKQVQQELSGSRVGEQKIDQRGEFRAAESELIPKESESSSGQKALPEADHKTPCPSALQEAQMGSSLKPGLDQEKQTENSRRDSVDPNGASVVFCQREMSQETRKSKRGAPSDAGGDLLPTAGQKDVPWKTSSHNANTRARPSSSAAVSSRPIRGSTRARSARRPHSKQSGSLRRKRTHRLPLTSNNTAQTNQNSLATSLRGLSVKPASSSASISSRSTLGEGGRRKCA
uniref:Protein SLX4IP n=1 Tax=Gasterosteus aculeatus aculeatus TaxID=481459 RepID=A0AAQ4Q1A3_GASAC